LTPSPVRVYLGLGSNRGDRAAHLARALELLDAGTGFSITRVSSVYETAPWGEEQQPAFLNAALEADVDLPPIELLAFALSVEDAMGRRRSLKWGPRVIDIDILLYGDRVVSETELQIPHPLLTARQFVLVPLLELAPHLVLPGGDRVVDLADERAPGVVRYAEAPWSRGSGGECE